MSAAVTPRAVANKSDRRTLVKAIRLALGLESAAVRHNTQTFNRNRYRAVAALPDYDALKDEARGIKERAIANLPALLEQLRDSITAPGGHFFLARDAAQARDYIRDVLLRHHARLVVKGKSMTSEEVRLNRELERAGIEVAETDLAEFILQVADEQPSHVIAPAIHYSRERITALFKRTFETGLPLDTGEDLTRFARERLREKFLAADAGITGANLIAAADGSLMLVESEGNIRMTCLCPPLHIAIAGVEKVVPSRAEFGPFVELLAASGTGQPLSSYTSFLRPPIEAPPFAFRGQTKHPREFHLVLVDNGRFSMRDDPVLREALYCIRCSACLNSCANFQTVGGHAFGGETYSGGIGGSWEAGTGTLENARFNELCTGCSRCVPQCPVRIDIPWLNDNLRDRLNQRERSLLSEVIAGLVPPPDHRARLPKLFFANYHVFAALGTRLAPLSNWIGRLPLSRLLMEKTVGLDRRRELPAFPSRPLTRLAASVRRVSDPRAKVALLADVYSNYGDARKPLAVIRVLQAAGVDVTVTACLPEGRAALSQGMIATARAHAAKTAALLKDYLAEGRDIVVIEPSALAMLRRDYRHLLDNAELVALLRERSFEPLQYVWKLLSEAQADPRELFQVERFAPGPRLFYHSHCQQKTIGAAPATEALLRAVGFEVATSSVECCGMAGSFGYKKDYYELSMAVGEDLFQQVALAEQDGARTLVASGVSCIDQLRAGTRRPVLHPAEVLAGTLA